MKVIYKKRFIKGFTLVEVMVALGLITFILIFVAYLMLYNGKSQAILFPQMTRQLAAVRSAQSISDLIRNAYYDPADPTHSVVISDGGKTVTFTSSELPDNQTCQIKLVGSNIVYDSDTNDTNNPLRTLGRDIQNLAFTKVDLDQMIEISVSFIYRKYRGYDTTSVDQLNGTFTTRVFPRNS